MPPRVRAFGPRPCPGRDDGGLGPGGPCRGRGDQVRRIEPAGCSPEDRAGRRGAGPDRAGKLGCPGDPPRGRPRFRRLRARRDDPGRPGFQRHPARAGRGVGAGDGGASAVSGRRSGLDPAGASRGHPDQRPADRGPAVRDHRAPCRGVLRARRDDDLGAGRGDRRVAPGEALQEASQPVPDDRDPARLGGRDGRAAAAGRRVACGNGGGVRLAGPDPASRIPGDGLGPRPGDRAADGRVGRAGGGAGRGPSTRSPSGLELARRAGGRATAPGRRLGPGVVGPHAEGQSPRPPACADRQGRRGPGR